MRNSNAAAFIGLLGLDRGFDHLAGNIADLHDAGNLDKASRPGQAIEHREDEYADRPGDGACRRASG